jgi:hypothetical protein
VKHWAALVVFLRSHPETFRGSRDGCSSSLSENMVSELGCWLKSGMRLVSATEIVGGMVASLAEVWKTSELEIRFETSISALTESFAGLEKSAPEIPGMVVSDWMISS